MKLRTQLTLVTTIFVAVLVAAAGLIVVLRDDHRDRDTIDAALSAKAAAVQSASGKSGALPDESPFVLRLLDNDKARTATGPKIALPLPSEDGFTTVRVNGVDWRSVVTPLKTGARLQVALSLADAKDRHDSNVLVVDLMVLIAALLTAAGAWWLGGMLQRNRPAAEKTAPVPEKPAARKPEPVPDRLPEFAAAVAALGPDDRLPAAAATPDEAALAALINNLLDKAATPALPIRQLRADLENLLDNPEMPATQRHLIMAAMLDTLNNRA